MKQSPIPKVIALVLVTIVVCLLLSSYDVYVLKQIASMSPSAFIQHERELHQHSFEFHFIDFLVIGGFYVGLIEFIAYLIGLVIPKKLAGN